jgi:hypothetical protein
MLTGPHIHNFFVYLFLTCRGENCTVLKQYCNLQQFKYMGLQNKKIFLGAVALIAQCECPSIPGPCCKSTVLSCMMLAHPFLCYPHHTHIRYNLSKQKATSTHQILVQHSSDCVYHFSWARLLRMYSINTCLSKVSDFSPMYLYSSLTPSSLVRY